MFEAKNSSVVSDGAPRPHVNADIPGLARGPAIHPPSPRLWRPGDMAPRA